MSDLKKIPKFMSPEEEARFWDEHDSADYVDWSKEKDVPYQSLMKVYLSDQVKQGAQASP